MNRVIAFGTFDIFHPGHFSFLRQAKKLGKFLLVVIARDQFVKKQKGRFPKNSDKARAEIVRKSKIADKVVLGSKTHNFFRTLRTYRINTIALGYDQKPKIPELKKQLKKHRLANLKIIRLKPYNPSKYKSSKLSANV